jgi:hypothetical protein
MVIEHALNSAMLHQLLPWDIELVKDEPEPNEEEVEDIDNE